ncbi:MAG: copper resistance protein B [Alphaproteobacteria bacterium]|nr:copper resistance protein B [Alphaproteobacteria bacterium]MBU1514531.1 copper resistance protein B [Alphaproteobacteria bacterium]MBU2096837.1 copper resistance protein B [Alphaproteobacteria bacterium]MBU2153464.1 copper resistance protein B [Alphaproteobacteria bacterium]MBU2306031.1 copper resistance protein B [Alphaproteobacteria bacterium]
MRRLLLSTAVFALAATAAQAQDPHAGHKMPAPAADPHAGHAMPATPAAVDPHAGHSMPAPATDPHAGHVATGAQLPVGDAPAPAAATDHLADKVFDSARMEQARAVLREEHGGMTLSRTMIDRLELRPGAGRSVYAWEAEFRYGGDIDRLVIKTEGEGVRGDLADAEVQALYSRAIGPYFDLQAGVRQDFEPRPRRTYAVLGVEGLAPYWFDVEGALFLSDTGDLSARLEGSYDLRLSQRLILQPRGEFDIAAQDTRSLGIGSGLSKAEVGLRLRYEIERQFAPYVGVNFERRFGRTADLARAAGEDVSDTRVVVGLRAWF